MTYNIHLHSYRQFLVLIVISYNPVCYVASLHANLRKLETQPLLIFLPSLDHSPKSDSICSLSKASDGGGGGCCFKFVFNF